MDFEDVKASAIQLLRERVPDVNFKRKSENKNWIFGDAPRRDVTQYPRIAVECASAENDFLSIGSYDLIKKFRVSISVFVSKKNKIDLFNNGEMSDYLGVCSFLVDKIKSEFFNKDNISFYFDSVVLVKPLSDETTDNNESYVKRINTEVWVK